MDADSTGDLPKILYDAMLRDPTANMGDDMLERMAMAYISEPQAWSRCREVLKQFKGKLKETEKRVVMLAREFQQIRSIGGPPSVEKTVREIWDAPVDGELYAPTGYKISDSRPAIERVKQRMVGDAPYEERIAVSLDPLLVTRRIGHVQSKSLLLEVKFRTSEGWRRILVDRDIVLNSRKIVDTAKLGLPVASDNALEIVSWIRHYETTNRDKIPTGFVSSSMGWQGEDHDPTAHGFMCGVKQLGGNGRAIELDGSDGDMAEARKIRPNGTFDGWLRSIRQLVHFPAIRLGIVASLAAPLLAVLHAPNAIIEWAGRTSRGKSTVLLAAQSCWRSTSDRMATWNTTIMGVEAAAQFLCDMPLIVDDTAAAVKGGRSQDIAKVIYQLMSGRARGRATRDGTQKARASWRTVVISSGEAPLGELAQAEGASARVLTFWSNPLGKTSKETGQLADRVIDELSVNYGHAGPRVVRWLCENRSEWDHLRRIYSVTTDQVRDKICTPAASRLASVVGLLQTAAYVARMSETAPWQKPLLDDPEILEALERAMDLATSSSDRAFQAWEHVTSIAESLPKSWIAWGHNPDPDRDPPGGWLGVRSAEEWCWFPAQIRKALTQGGYQPDTVMRAWKDAGALRSQGTGYASVCRPYLGRETIRLVRIVDAYPGYELEEAYDP